MAQRLSSAEMVTRFIDERMSRELPAQQACAPRRASSPVPA